MRRRCGRGRGGRIGINSVLWGGLFCLATNEIAQTGLSSLPPVITIRNSYLDDIQYAKLCVPVINFEQGKLEVKGSIES